MNTSQQRVGTVVKVSPCELRVRISQRSACQGCHAYGTCTSADCRDRYLTLAPPSGVEFSEGEQVGVVAHDSVGRWATLLAFALPLPLLVGVLYLSVSVIELSEIWSCLLVLSVLALYYLVLYLFTPQLRRLLRMEVAKLPNTQPDML